MMEVVAQGAERLGLSLTPTQVRQFEVYYHELVDWNRKINLTSVTSYEEVQAKHFVDSLTVIPALREMFPSSLHTPLRVVDIGAGAGLPGLPLKILLPDIRLFMVESIAKKAAFLRHLVEVLGLADVEVVVGRAEELAHKPDWREGFDLCLARGVAGLPALLELTLPFVRLGGFFIAHKGVNVDEELKASAKALAILGGHLNQVKEVRMDRILSPRVLVIIEKVDHTPAAFPRRPGLPAKRPL